MRCDKYDFKLALRHDNIKFSLYYSLWKHEKILEINESVSI